MPLRPPPDPEDKLRGIRSVTDAALSHLGADDLLPLLVHGAALGVLHVGTVRARVFISDDAALLQMAADRAALAVQSLRSREDQAAALALQRSLVPSALPAVRGAEVAAPAVSGGDAGAARGRLRLGHARPGRTPVPRG
jgi:phosphoserine phosphatase RsbU/P